MERVILFLAISATLVYGTILILDHLGRKKRAAAGEALEAAGLPGGRKPTMVYPPGFEFLQEAPPAAEPPPQDLDNEVRGLVRLYEKQTNEVYKNLHRLLKYSEAVEEMRTGAEQTRCRIEEEMGCLREELTHLQEVRDSQIISINELENDVQRLKEELAAAAARADEAARVHAAEVEGLNGRITAMEQTSIVLGGEKEGLAAEMMRLSSDNAGLASAKAELEARITADEAELADLRPLREQTTDLGIRLTEAETRLADRTRAADEGARAEAAADNETIAMLESRIASADARAEALEARLAGLAADNDRLQTAAETAASEAAERTADDLGRTTTALKEELDRARAAQERLEEEARVAAGELTRLKTAAETAAARPPAGDGKIAKALNKENKELKEELARVKAACAAMEIAAREAAETKALKIDLQKEIRRAVDAETALLAVEIERLKAAQSAGPSEELQAEWNARIEDLQREVIRRDNTLDQLNRQIEELKRRHSTTTNERTDEVACLHEELRRKDAAIAAAQTAAAAAEKRAAGIEQGVVEERSHLKVLEKENTGFAERIEHFLKVEDSLQMELRRFEEMLTEERSKTEDVNTRLIGLQATRDAERRAHEDAVARLESEVSRASLVQAEKDKAVRSHSTTIQSKEEEIGELRKKIAAVDKDRADWRREGDFLREKIATLEKQGQEARQAGRANERLAEEHRAATDKARSLGETLVKRQEEIEKLTAALQEERQKAAAAGASAAAGVQARAAEAAGLADKMGRRDRELVDVRRLVAERDRENTALHEKIVSAEDLIGKLQGRIAILETETRERTLSDKEKVLCSRCFGEVTADDLSLKKARRLEGKVVCKFCLAEAGGDQGALEIEDGLARIAELVSELRTKKDWTQYKEIEIAEQLVALGPDHLPLLVQVANAEKDKFVRTALTNVINILKKGEKPEVTLIDDDLERTAYLIQKLRAFPGKPDEGKGRDICRKLVELGPSIAILLGGISRQETDPAMKAVLGRVQRAIQTGRSFDEVV
ncbi:MAG: hypothetical protein ABIF71_02365 [Planctomycetota bacterium]